MQTNIYAKYHLSKHKEDILEENFKKPLVPYSHFWQDHCVYLYTYVYDELHFWYLKRVVTQMSRVSSFNVKNVSTWNNAVYYTHENYVFTFVLCLDFKSSGTHKNFRISLTCLVSGFKKTLFFLMSHSYTIKSRDLNLSWNLNFETFHM